MLGAPGFLGHFHAVSADPGDVLDLGSAEGAFLKEFRLVENRMGVPEVNEFAREGSELVGMLGAIPLQPADRIVLAVGVVVASLGAAVFVATTRIGTPCDRKSVARKLRCIRRRRAWTSLGAWGPSCPQFQELL
ncbi:MAG: hypothetical protein ABIZ81_14420 [Opitutaceae bacterium]